MTDSTYWIGQECWLAGGARGWWGDSRLGGGRCALLTALHRTDPLFIMQEYMTDLVSRGREGKLNDGFSMGNGWVA